MTTAKDIKAAMVARIRANGLPAQARKLWENRVMGISVREDGTLERDAGADYGPEEGTLEDLSLAELGLLLEAQENVTETFAMERPSAFTPAWYAEAFKYAENPIPEDIRKAAVRIVETHDIRGICDPMYIANLIAMHMERGNGSGRFVQGDPVYLVDRDGLIEKTVTNLAFAYSSSRGVTKDAIRQALIEQLRY